MQAFHGPALWHGSELAERPDWRHDLSRDEIAEIDFALGGVKRLGRRFDEIRREEFMLPVFSEKLAAARDSLEHGSGSFFLRGWPVGNYDLEDNQRVFWGISRHLGTPISQSAAGEKIYHVRDAGLPADDPGARGPNTSKALHFHCDRCDVIGFLCIHAARRGGDSFLVSSPAVHNAILERRPDLLAELYKPWYYKTHNVDTANPDRWCRQPIFAIEDGHFVGYVLRVLIDRAYELPELPDMTPLQREALDLLDAVCAEQELHYQFRQEPGDMLFVNNFVNFHSRSGYEDHDEPEHKRLLLRIWLSTPNSRPLPKELASSFGRVGAGELRGGIHPVR